MQHTFHKDQPVRLADPKSQVTLFAEKDRTPEDEIYTVLEVELVPTNCTCGAVYGIPHHEDCGVNSLQETGHPQWVVIQTSKGEHHLSGAWLKPA